MQRWCHSDARYELCEIAKYIAASWPKLSSCQGIDGVIMSYLEMISLRCHLKSTPTSTLSALEKWCARLSHPTIFLINISISCRYGSPMPLLFCWSRKYLHFYTRMFVCHLSLLRPSLPWTPHSCVRWGWREWHFAALRQLWLWCDHAPRQRNRNLFLGSIPRPFSKSRQNSNGIR